MTKGSYSGNDFFGRMELTYRVVARSSDAAISREIISIALLWLFSVSSVTLCESCSPGFALCVHFDFSGAFC